jgi:hypothetical protein
VDEVAANSGHYKPLCACVDRTFVTENFFWGAVGGIVKIQNDSGFFKDGLAIPSLSRT